MVRDTVLKLLSFENKTILHFLRFTFPLSFPSDVISPFIFTRRIRLSCQCTHRSSLPRGKKISLFFKFSSLLTGSVAWIAQGQWPRPENATDGVICGGGTRAPAFAWGNESPFVAVNGDAGQLITMRLEISGSTLHPVVPTSDESFSIILARDVPLPESGVMCLPVNVGTDYPAGSRALLYIEARDADDTDRSDVDSTCSGKLIN